MSNRLTTMASKKASLPWLLDTICAILIAASLSVAVSAVMEGRNLVFSVALAGLCAVSALRSLTQVKAATDGQRAADQAKAGWRALCYPALLSAAPGNRRMLGEEVADAVDRVEDLDGYHARFLPLRFAAVVSPLLIAAAAVPASWVAAMILFATLAPFGLGMALAGTAAARAARRQLEALGHLSGLFVDRLRALPVIVGFGAEERVGRHLAQATREVADRTLGVLRIAFLSGAIMEFFAALSVALVAVYCGFNLLGLLPFPAPEKLTLGQALYVLVLAPEFYLPMRRLAAAYHDKQTGEAATERLEAFRRDGVDKEMPELGRPPELRFEGVSIDHDGASVGPFSFIVPAGRMTAISAPSGAGKSSLLHALLGMARVGEGRLLLDGKEGAACLLPGHVGWAGQVVALLPGTLADNIRLACPQADEAAVERAARKAGLGPMIEARGQGMALPIDHRGSGLSGGERRRIAIARVLLKDAPLWLLDEPTADLDAASAADIGAILYEAGRGRTVLLATHSEALAALADHRVML
ncbi:MAG: thiol reductant ABC exporter subunit CydD [Sphingomonadales bacterium]|nr:MAG: thiol reductant ABC exporter subunit CydD [Sphingomonadales bacterium]TNF04404.1 MAG: thiol reductant ABC exporter subunit CydD [Sphingomonadales bacterium]